MIRLSIVALVALVVIGYLATPPSTGFDGRPYVEKGKTYDVEIVRDTYGVPHVYGKRDADVAYGLAYAIAEDDFETVQTIVLAMRGRLSTVRGPEAGPTDYLVGLFDVWGTVDRRYETDTGTAARALAEAYADGINHYAALHPNEVMPNVIPVTGKDIVAGFVFKMPFMYGLDRTLRKLFAGDTGAGGGAGSNAFAVAPHRSGDGKTRLVVNSHQPYVGPVSWYEARLKSEEGLDVYGGTFPGAPLILHGHNRHLGWASTVNEPDLVDVYELEMHPDDPKQYKFGDGWETLETREVPIEVKVFGRLTWTVEREALYSKHGPVLRTATGWYALRYAGRDEVRQLDQYLRLNRATGLESFKNAMRRLAIPSLNFTYADAKGNVAMFHNAKLPVRKEGVDWSGILPGDDPSLIWNDYVPFDDGPHTVNPPSGFVFETNHTPFVATDGDGNPDPASFSKTLGLQTNLTNRARRVQKLVKGMKQIDRKALERIKYDKTYEPESDMAKELEKICKTIEGDDELLVDAKRLVCGWDLSADAKNTRAALAISTIEPILQARRDGRRPPDVASLLLLNARILMRTSERLEVPWEKVNRIKRGRRSAGLGGGPDTLRAVHSEGLEEDGTRTASKGDTFIVFVEWDEAGNVKSESVHQFGSATTRPGSPHYGDQMQLFADEQLKPVWLDAEELAKHTERRYRPGQ